MQKTYSVRIAEIKMLTVPPRQNLIPNPYPFHTLFFFPDIRKSIVYRNNHTYQQLREGSIVR